MLPVGPKEPANSSAVAHLTEIKMSNGKNRARGREAKHGLVWPFVGRLLVLSTHDKA
jgi:hypothetical protein